MIAKGSQGILAYLHDRYVSENDSIIEKWAEDQNTADKLEDEERDKLRINVLSSVGDPPKAEEVVEDQEMQPVREEPVVE